jgi:hypothetical protein
MEHQEGARETRRHAREGGEPIPFGIAEFESNSGSGPPCIQIDVQIAYDLCFVHSTYAQKYKEITFPMTLVSCPGKIGFVHHHQNSTNFQNCFCCCATILA